MQMSVIVLPSAAASFKTHIASSPDLCHDSSYEINNVSAICSVFPYLSRYVFQFFSLGMFR